MMMKEGIIYKATNVATGEVYIGATTISLHERINDHYNKATKNCGHKFQNAIREYGFESFIWEQIDTGINTDELALKEKYYIQKFDSFHNGYNSDRGGGFKKTLYQYNLTGELESTFQSLEEASKSSSISEDSISHACLGDRKTSNGFYWTYTSTFNLKEDIRKKKVVQYDFEGKTLNVFDSIAEASIATEINKSSIAKCCRGERKKAGDFIWKFLD